MNTTWTIRGQKPGRAGKFRIVAFTAHAHGEDHGRCFEAGMDAVVSKPIDRDALFAVLRDFLGT